MEQYSNTLEQAHERHHEDHDAYSFECNPITGAVTYAAAGPVQVSEPTDAATSDRIHPKRSTLINDEPRPDPPVEAHVEPDDRSASKALQDVPHGLSDAPTNLKTATRRPDWPL